MTSALLRAARAALNWSYVEASRRAGVSVAVVLAAEGRRIGSTSPAGIDALWKAYEEAGVHPLDDSCGRGIRIGAS